MARPSAETNEPLPPELKRTLDFCRCSSHCGVGSKLYFSFNCLSGGLLNSHMPSSANVLMAGKRNRRTKKRENIAQPKGHWERSREPALSPERGEGRIEWDTGAQALR